jgi:aspartate carbamoyltransferase catalytic subunit
MNKNSLLSMRDLSVEDIYSILDDARLFNSSFKDWQLPMQKALVANLFFEASTRTHFSFESAQHQLGCQVADFAAGASSVTKGETLYDTVKTFESISCCAKSTSGVNPFCSKMQVSPQDSISFPSTVIVITLDNS